MSEQHLPVVQLVEESDTDQPNGLMIKFNVDARIFMLFSKDILDCASGATTRTNLTCNLK